MNQQYFHFTLGPVQGFVAQARRTRDFWAGSFILSWLSAVAIQAVQKQGGEIVFPRPHKAFLDALEGKEQQGPKQGSIPNRFKAGVPKDFQPERVSTAVQAAWTALANKVWNADLAGVARHGINTKDIWYRQIEHFWDIEWALVPDEDTHDVLDRLKNWRTHLPPDEPGIKCMMMDAWQELSGVERPGKRENDPNGPAQFWKTVREQADKTLLSDLREGEFLCAIAFVKRRFVRHFEHFQCTLWDDFTLHGWRLPKGVPSVYYLAAAHWLEAILKKADTDSVATEIESFRKDARALTNEYSEWATDIHCISSTVTQKTKTFSKLNGEVFFESALCNLRMWLEDKREAAPKLVTRLRALQNAAEIKAATPFYAILLMDGDELGKHLREHADDIANGLEKFTHHVQGIVQSNNGFLVYAGGDDVLAILPLEDALPCATALHHCYQTCFANTQVKTTLSGAIEYAHIKTPLGKVLADAHELLDQIAKEKYGRDSIACRVCKPGDKQLEWAMPWKMALDGYGKPVIQQLADQFRQQAIKEIGKQNNEYPHAIANRFFFRIQHYFRLFENGNRPLDKKVLDLLAMEYIDSGLAQTKNMQKAKVILQPLLDQCQPERRDKDRPQHEWTDLKPNPHAAMLLRFLAQKGAE